MWSDLYTIVCSAVYSIVLSCVQYCAQLCREVCSDVYSRGDVHRSAVANQLSVLAANMGTDCCTILLDTALRYCSGLISLLSCTACKCTILTTILVRLENGRLVGRHDGLSVASPSHRSQSTMDHGPCCKESSVGVLVITSQGYIVGICMSPPTLNMTQVNPLFT